MGPREGNRPGEGSWRRPGQARSAPERSRRSLNVPPPHVFLAWRGLKGKEKNYMRNGQNVLRDYFRGKKSEMQVVLFFPFGAETNFISAPSPTHS